MRLDEFGTVDASGMAGCRWQLIKYCWGFFLFRLVAPTVRIRNCTDIPAVLRTAHRVLKPGGRFMCLEFSHVSNPVLAQVVRLWAPNGRVTNGC